MLLSNLSVTDTEIDLTRYTPKQLLDQYNYLATQADRATVARFADRQAGARRLRNLIVELQDTRPEVIAEIVKESAEESTPAAETEGETAPVMSADIAAAMETLKPITQNVKIEAKPPKARRTRQKVFNYPPAGELRNIVAGSLRAQARDLLLQGATFEEVEALVRDFDITQGKPGTHRISERTYGLIRLLHTYIGYALVERNVDGVKKIFILDAAGWQKFKELQSA